MSQQQVATGGKRSRLPGISLMLSRSLYEPVHTGLHTPHGMSSIQEVGDSPVFQGLVPSGPFCVCQCWEQAQTSRTHFA